MTGLIVVVLGALLCFAGLASIHLAVLLSGFGVSWLVADSVGASSSTALIVGAIGAVVAWVIVSLVLRTALFFVGAVSGAVIGAKLYSVLDNERTVVVVLIFAAGFAVLGGWMADRWRMRVLVWLTALGGAGVVLNGLGRSFDSLGALRSPANGGERALDAVIWVVLALLGWAAQRKVSARALR